MTGKRNARGFTLKELLIVIAIIALQLSIIMPALKAGRNNAKDTVCAANLKKWAICYKLYTQDFNDEFPPFEGGTGNVTYMKSLRYYYGNNNKLQTCPVATKVSPDNPTGVQPLSFFGDTRYAWRIDSTAGWVDDEDCSIGSYTENMFIRNMPGERCWKKITSIKNRSNVPMIGDGKWCSAWPDHLDPIPVAGKPPVYNISNWAQIYAYVMNRHKYGINMAFADMSVRYITPEDLWSLEWHRNYKTRTDIDLSNMNR